MMDINGLCLVENVFMEGLGMLVSGFIDIEFLNFLREINLVLKF